MTLLRQINVDAFLAESLSKLQALNSVDAQIVLHDLVDEKFRIFPHRALSSQRPLSSVAMHPAEDFTTDSMLESTVSAYVDSSIYEFFHLSLTEFMGLPPDIVELLFEIAGKKKAKKTTDIDNLQAQLQSDIKRESKK